MNAMPNADFQMPIGMPQPETIERELVGLVCDLAFAVARALAMFVRRPGGQNQFSALLQSQTAERQPLRDLLVWASEHLTDSLSVETLAARVHMSARNFSRAFRKELGKTPARFIETLRIDAAARMLEQTGVCIDHVAKECGLGSADSMRRSFLRAFGHPPQAIQRTLAASSQ